MGGGRGIPSDLDFVCNIDGRVPDSKRTRIRVDLVGRRGGRGMHPDLSRKMLCDGLTSARVALPCLVCCVLCIVYCVLRLRLRLCIVPGVLA